MVSNIAVLRGPVFNYSLSIPTLFSFHPLSLSFSCSLSLSLVISTFPFSLSLNEGTVTYYVTSFMDKSIRIKL